MTAHHTAADKRLLMTLSATLVVALGAFGSTAAAKNGHVQRLAPPVEDGTYVLVHPTRKLIKPTHVNTFGLLSTSGAVAQVDETGHVVNAKGARVGGMTPDS